MRVKHRYLCRGWTPCYLRLSPGLYYTCELQPWNMRYDAKTSKLCRRNGAEITPTVGMRKKQFPKIIIIL